MKIHRRKFGHLGDRFWYEVGTKLVQRWYEIGTELVRSWYGVGIKLLQGWYKVGIGLVLGISYELLEDIKLITFEPEISHLLMIIAVAYMAGIIIGQRRYK